MAAPLSETRTKAEEALGKGDAKAAFDALRSALDWPGALAEPLDWEEGLDLFARVADGMGDTALGSLLRDTSRTYNDPNALHDLGYQLIERGLTRIAATVLVRARDLSPDNAKVLGELAFALGESGHPEEAVRALRGAPEAVERDFSLSYLFAFHSIMCRDLEEAARRLPRLLAAARNPKSSDLPFMAATIEGMLARAEAVRHATPLDEEDLRGWQFVVNGNFLLHLSPHGEEVMRGRYGFHRDSPELSHEGIRRLSCLFEAVDVAVPRVFFLPDRASEALARAAAKELHVEAAPWPKGGTKEQGLVVADDLAAFPRELIETVFTHAPGQRLWAQARCWTQRGPFAEDCVTILHQFRKSPWDEPLQAGVGAGGSRPGPVEGSPEELAARILDTRVDTDALADLPELIQLAHAACRMTGPHAPGLVRTEGKRRRSWVDSPVRSNCFL